MRTPDWQSDDGAIQLYCCDCLELLPGLSGADAVVTDPPYGIGDRMQGGTWGAADKYADFRRWDIAPEPETIAWLTQHPSVIWGGNYFHLPPSRCWLAWQKINAVPTMATVELAWTNLDRPAKSLLLPVGVHSHGHPTEKPLPLMEWSIGFVAGTILDPFMGSGTTGVACIRTGRKFIGIELEPKYFETAKKRIKAELAQPRLFAPEPESWTTPSLFVDARERT